MLKVDWASFRQAVLSLEPEDFEQFLYEYNDKLINLGIKEGRKQVLKEQLYINQLSTLSVN